MQTSSEADLAENDLEDILQTDHSDFPLFASHNNSEALAAALHAAQGDFQSHVFLQVKSGLHIIRDGPIGVQIGPKQERVQADQADDSLLAVARFPDRQARD